MREKARKILEGYGVPVNGVSFSTENCRRIISADASGDIYSLRLLKCGSRSSNRTQRWRDLRQRILQERGLECASCGITPDSIMHVHIDHIKPKSKYPELEYDESNLQVLCKWCNFAKAAR